MEEQPEKETSIVAHHNEAVTRSGSPLRPSDAAVESQDETLHLWRSNGIYIIDLQKTVRLFKRAYTFIQDTVAAGGGVLFVGTKKQAQDAVYEEAARCGQYYVNQRWLGGMLTNFSTIKQSIERLNQIGAILDKPEETNLHEKGTGQPEPSVRQAQQELGRNPCDEKTSLSSLHSGPQKREHSS